jgi:hypothetical protein
MMFEMQAMRQLKRFTALSVDEHILLLRAFAWVIVIRLGLWLLPFRFVRQIAASPSRKGTQIQPLSRYIWAVRVVSRYVPCGTCLTQAMAAQTLLAASGYDSRVEIGVNTDEQCRFQAHAWLVCGDEIVLGGAQAGSYVPLASWKSSPESLRCP